MRLKTKLAKLEQRLGVEDCPHCGKPIVPQAWGVIPQEYTDEEWFLLVRKIFQRYYNRDELLFLLAGTVPALRLQVADVYPLSADESLLAAEVRKHELATASGPSGR